MLSYTQNVWAVGFRALIKQINLYRSYLCAVMALIMVLWHKCYKLVVLPTEFLWYGYFELKQYLNALPENIPEVLLKLHITS